MEASFVFCSIIRCREIKPEDVAEFVFICEMKSTPASAPSMLREPSKYIFQYSGIP
jgi:hypothetical protein